MLVEDDPPTSTALRAILAHRGWDVTVASTLADALARLDASLACVVLDLMLPDGNGIEVLRAARRNELPPSVIVTTGLSDAAVLTEVAALRPVAVLQKPIKLPELLRTLPAPEPGGQI